MQQEAVGEKLGLVSYRVEIRAGLQGLGGAPQWRVRAFELEEQLSAPYRLSIALVSDVPFDVQKLAGAAFELTMHREDGDSDPRSVHGIVLQAIDAGRYSKKQHARLLVGPKLALADLSVRSRIFQNTTVVDIARDVLGTRYVGDAIDSSRLRTSPRVRDYCVQFRETDLAFVQRILAEEGIAFIFDHENEEDRIVLVDDASAFLGAPSSVEGGGSSSVPLWLPVATLGNGQGEREHVTRFEWKRAVHPTSGSLEQWDWKSATPQTFSAYVQQEGLPPWVGGEQVLFGDRRLTEADEGAGPQVDDSLDVVRRHLARRLREAEVAHGSTNALGVAAGTTIEIQGHPDSELDRAYYVTHAIHRADCPEVDILEGSPFAGANYENEIECVPVGVPFYARVPEKPRVLGPQTATVVGPATDDIHTDVHGRIQVRMHWDREQRGLESGTSAWLRVVQAWAGPGWGTMFIPRVGMEVVVAFLDGDPDRPMCVGCVYNGKNTPPYALPDEKTKSTIKTRSTPGGNGSNELRFEDAAGAEEVYLHAQRDLVERVEREHRVSIGAAESIEVGGTQTVGVGGHQDVTVRGGQSIMVKGEAIGDAQAPDPAHLLDVIGAIEQHASETVTIQAPKSLTLQCEGSVLRITPDAILIQTGSGATINLTAAIAMLSKDAQVMMELTDQGALKVLTSAGSQLSVEASLEYRSPELSSLVVDAGHTFLTSTGAQIAMTDSIAATASKVEIVATPGASLELTDAATLAGISSATLEAGAGVEAGPAGVKVKGLTVDLSGAAAISVAAPNVKIN
jgi:type VI secretion system secreted protein VgrG